MTEKELKEYAKAEDKEKFKEENDVTDDNVTDSFIDGFRSSGFTTPREYLNSLYR